MASLSPRNMAMAPEFQDADLEVPEARALPNPSGIRIPSAPGSGPPGVEQFDLRTPANAGGEVDKMEALEKKVDELEAIIQKIVARRMDKQVQY